MMIKNNYYKFNKINKRICLIGDIHYSFNYDNSIFKSILDNIHQNTPDFICVCGDLVDDAKTLLEPNKDKITHFIKNLSLIAPVIVVKGNHDETVFINKKHKYLNTNDYFLSLNKLENVYYLDNKTLVRNDISFTGLSLDFDYYYNKKHENNYKFIEQLDKLNKIDLNKYNILLSHSPINVLTDLTIEESKNISKFDLILSGHMHNGLVFNFLDRKGNRGFIGPFNKLLPKYAKGKTTKKLINKDINLIVTGGVIKFSKCTPKLLQKINWMYPIHIDYIDI